MLFFQLDHFQPASAGQNTNLTWMDYEFTHVPKEKGIVYWVLQSPTCCK